LYFCVFGALCKKAAVQDYANLLWASLFCWFALFLIRDALCF